MKIIKQSIAATVLILLSSTSRSASSTT